MFEVLDVCVRDRFFGKIVVHAAMARKNNLVPYEEVYRLMITFFICKDNPFRISCLLYINLVNKLFLRKQK